MEQSTAKIRTHLCIPHPDHAILSSTDDCLVQRSPDRPVDPSLGPFDSQQGVIFLCNKIAMALYVSLRAKDILYESNQELLLPSNRARL
jgi:hypothetical protein